MVTDPEQPGEADALRAALTKITDQLCQTIDGDFDVHVTTDEDDETLQTLTILINYVLGNALMSVDKLEDTNRELDQVVQQRTAELHHAKSVAEQASQAKSNFLAQMSHELRTPLNSIIGFAQLLLNNKKDVLNERQNKQTTHILRGGNHLLGLINDVLDLNKIESGTLDVNLESISPSDVIEDSLVIIQPLADDAGITLERRFETTGNVPNIQGDYLRIKQCLINLLNNAIKYNEEGGKAWMNLEVFAGERVRFIVGDTGLGIPANRHHELFKPFSRLGRETGDIDGSGVGLALTRLLVHAMDGVIDFESEEGKGTRFWFDLPVSETGTSPSRAARTMEDAEQGIRLKGRVLYIEDNASNIMLMHDILDEYTDIDLMTAETAEVGIDLATQHLPDIIVMDINLAGMSGIDAVRYLKSVDATKGIPVVGLSADARDATRRRAAEVGMTDFFAKPIEIGPFINCLGALLADKQEVTS